MSQIEPGDREEMLLQGILNGETESNIEPGSRKEMLLKAILENGGGGGSGEIPIFELQNDGDYDYIQLPDGFWSDGKVVVFGIHTSNVNTYTVITYCRLIETAWASNGVVINNYGGRLFPTTVAPDSTGKMVFNPSNYESFNIEEQYLRISSQTSYGQSGNAGLILAGNGKGKLPSFKSFSVILEESGYIFEAVDPVTSFNSLILLLGQQGVFTAMETLSSASSETYVSKYLDVSQMATEQQIKGFISNIVNIVEQEKKIPYIRLETNSLGWVKDYVQLSGETGYLTFEYSTWTNDKKFVHEITISYPKLYITTICHEATSLM